MANSNDCHVVPAPAELRHLFFGVGVCMAFDIAAMVAKKMTDVVDGQKNILSEIAPGQNDGRFDGIFIDDPTVNSWTCDDEQKDGRSF